ncbi:unnamed protein product [Ectocarpus fasciculatus]
MLLGSMDSCLPPKSRTTSLRRPLRQLSLGQEPLPASPLISTRNLVPGLSESVVQLDILGKGATSNVFLAVHAATLKMVALKEVTVSNDADRWAVRTEMRALKTQRSPLLNSAFTTKLASCPRIVDYYGSVVRENGNACIAVEYVAGGSLESWLENSGASVCPEPWFAHIAHQALEALDFVHSCGRVHRDVKPANLLITRNGDLKLGDFGAAGVENSSRMVGTQRFMAPERLKGHRATAQSDLWSLGLSLATAALGDDFISQGSNQFVQLDMACRVRKRLSKTTTLSAELMDFLHSCLSRDPARRPALRDLMKHPFLSQRQDWQAKCPEVALAMRDRKRLQSGDGSAIEEVLDALCHVRAEENLIGTGFDPATAADLAYELGVTTDSLVRDVHRRTLEFIRERGGGSSSSVGLSSSGGVSDSGDENGDEMMSASGRSRDSDGGEGRWRTTMISGGGGIVGDEARRRRRRCTAHDDASGGGGGGREPREERPFHRGGEGRREESCSPRPEPGRQAAADALTLAMDVIPTATREGDGSNPRSGGGNIAYPLVTPRNRPTRGGATGGAGFGGKHSTVSSNTRSRRRALEMSPAVKLTPHKRRGERKASQTKRSGSHCVANGTRRTSRGREKEGEAAAVGTEPETSIPGSPREQAAEVVEVAAAAAETAVEGVCARVTGTDGDHRVREASAASAAGSVSAGAAGADGLPSCRDNLGHTAACRRSWERKCKRNSKPRTASTRTLPSRADVRTRSMRGVFQLADEMKAQIAVRDRVHRLRVYPRCFSGREAVQWMLDGCHASSVIEAENIGNEMMKASVFQHILNSHVFEDSSVYYQFTDGDTPPPPSRGSRRLRQIARVVGGHVARRLVHSGSGANTPVDADGGGSSRPVSSSSRSVSGGSRPVSGSSRSGMESVAPAAAAAAAAARGIGAADCICPFANPHQTSRPGDRGSKVKRRSRGRGSQSVLQLRRFSSSMSTLTVPETPY